MTLAQIKSMFAVGAQVKVTREGNKPLVVNGNLGQTILPAMNGEELRTVNAIQSKEWVFSRGEGQRNVYTTYPKASEVIEAREGFVKFQYDNGTIITIEKV